MQEQTPQQPAPEEITEQIDNNVIVNLFAKHGISCEISDGILLFEKQHIIVHTRLFRRTHAAVIMLQLDFHLEFGFGKEIIESCTGMGDDLQSALNDAWINFTINSFHTLLAAFFTPDYDDQIERSDLHITDNRFTMICNPIITRGKQPGNTTTEWLQQFNTEITKHRLSNETHWIRLYYAGTSENIYGHEVLLDNNNWTELESLLPSFNFPITNEFSSVRLFMILQPGFDIARAAMTLGWMKNEEPEKIIARFAEDGMSLPTASKAYAFIPLAFGRAFLKTISNVGFSDKAILLTKENNEKEINLEDEPIFSLAYKLADDALKNRRLNRDHFITIISQSAEFNAYNNALIEGTKKEDLDAAKFEPPVITL
ncbi:DUF6348 family protein [Chitinophagaceae bacterium LWZ2-11]